MTPNTQFRFRALDAEARAERAAKRYALAQEALGRAQSGQSIANYGTIYAEFMARGIPESEIEPRENVLTFWAWQAKGRSVKKGEHGVKITVWVPVGTKVERDPSDGSTRGRMKLALRTATVFHLSQTRAMSEVR